MAHIDELLAIMDRLRDPEHGCPWDRQQTHETLVPYLLEEASEVAGSIEEGHLDELPDELGDLLFQIVFHARVAQEKGEFQMGDVVDHITRKMIHRHPHVFGEEKAQTAREVLARWEERKRREKGGRRSVLDGVPKELPALLRAHRLQDKAARVGFDWSRLDQVLAKVDEEIREFKETLKAGDPQRMEEELGDVFFALVNIARFVDVNPEEALRKTIARFIHRFRRMEEQAAQQGLDLSRLSLEEMDRLWEAAKSEERAPD